MSVSLELPTCASCAHSFFVGDNQDGVEEFSCRGYGPSANSKWPVVLGNAMACPKWAHHGAAATKIWERSKDMLIWRFFYYDDYPPQYADNLLKLIDMDRDTGTLGHLAGRATKAEIRQSLDDTGDLSKNVMKAFAEIGMVFRKE